MNHSERAAVAHAIQLLNVLLHEPLEVKLRLRTDCPGPHTPGWVHPAISPYLDGLLMDLRLSGGGFLITSGVRCPQHNAKVGGVPRSKHLKGFAVDVVPEDRKQCVAAALTLGLGVLDEPDHLHLYLKP